MSTGLREISAGDIQTALERILDAPARRSARQPPARPLRAGDRRGGAARGPALRAGPRRRGQRRPGASCSATPPLVPAEVAVTSTKLVELRNPDETGSCARRCSSSSRPARHASAEDSFGVATFEEVPLGDVYDELAARLLAELPADLRREHRGDPRRRRGGEVAAGDQLRARPLPADDPAQRQRPEVVGAAFFELGLVPDLTLFADPALIRTRTGHERQADAAPSRPDRSGAAAGAGTRPHGRHVPRQARQPSSPSTASTTRANGPAASWWTGRTGRCRSTTGRCATTTETEAVQLTVGELGLPRVGDQPEHANHPLLQNLARPAVPRRRAAGHEPASGQFRGPAGPAAHPGTGPVQRADRLRGSGPTGVVASVKPADDRPGPLQGHLPEAARRRPGTGLALRPDPAAGRRRESRCRSSLPTHGPHQPTTRASASSSSRHPEDDDDLDDSCPRTRPRSIAGVTQALRALSSGRSARAATGGPSSAGRIELEGPQRTGRDTSARVVRPARHRGDPAVPCARGHPAADCLRIPGASALPTADAGGRWRVSHGPFGMK